MYVFLDKAVFKLEVRKENKIRFNAHKYATITWYNKLMYVSMYVASVYFIFIYYY